MAMVEPFISHRVDGRVRNDLTAEAVIRSATVAAGLGWIERPHLAQASRSSTTWRPCWRRPTCRCCCSAARSPPTRTRSSRQWEKVLANPQVRGMVVGRSLLYPPDGDVAAAVDAVVGMM